MRDKQFMKHSRNSRQLGASLIEVLVAILILSFGMLSLGSMLSFSVQMPKLSGYRTTATNIASDHIERIRANSTEFLLGNYSSTLSYDATFNDISLADCVYPNCTVGTASGSPGTMALMDIAATQRAARTLLPAGGLLVTCDAAGCSAPNAYGNLWIVWQEPTTSAALNPTSSDNCPTQVTTTYTSPAPRCLYVRFKI